MIEPGTSASVGAGGQAGTLGMGNAETTGRFVLVFADTDVDPAPVLRSVAGLANVASSLDFPDQEVDLAQTDAADAVVFSELGIAVVTADPSQRGALQTSAESQGALLAVAPELVHHVLQDAGYVRGYRDGVADLTGRLVPGGASGTGAGPAPGTGTGASFQDSAQFTWGLQATGVPASPTSGVGVMVAVLDTGFDSTHPDFVGRGITARSFVPNETPQDGHGHGTHCVGTACGPKVPSTGPRYGVAYDAQVLVGKVLSDGGSGTDSGIIAGINWAVASGCHIISMSLGADVAQVHPPYTWVGKRALDRGSLIIAAAGNNADRAGGNAGFVGAPANSPFIMAVAALDPGLATANFSARSLPLRGGQVDVAGPGVGVHSSWRMPMQYRSISGTSMATPHAAGIAALWAEATGYRGRELWATMVAESQRLSEPSVDVGGGLVTAPR